MRRMAAFYLIGTVFFLAGLSACSSQSSPGEITPTHYEFVSCSTNLDGTNTNGVMTNVVSDYPPTYYSNFIYSNATAYIYKVTFISNALSADSFLYSTTNLAFFTNISGGVATFLSVQTVDYSVFSFTNVFATNSSEVTFYSATNYPVISNFVVSNLVITNRVSVVSNGTTNSFPVYYGTNISFDYLAGSLVLTNWWSNIVLVTNIADIFYTNLGSSWCLFSNIAKTPSLNYPMFIASNIDGTPLSCIGDNALSASGRSGVIVIPDTVTNIGNYAFYYSPDISGLTIGSNVRSIGNYAFYYTGHEKKFSDLVIPDSVISIGVFAFCGIGSDSPSGFRVTLGSNLRNIGSNAFYYCHGTGDLTIPDSVTNIGDNAFNSCSGFNGCLKIGTNVRNIGDNAFFTNQFTNSLIIPDSVCNIGEYAFRYLNFFCTGLYVNSSNIGKGAFQDCWGLTSLTLGSNVRNIGDMAFHHGALSNVVVYAQTPPVIGQTIFESCRDLKTITVPHGTLAAYNSAGWYSNNLGAYYLTNMVEAD